LMNMRGVNVYVNDKPDDTPEAVCGRAIEWARKIDWAAPLNSADPEKDCSILVVTEGPATNSNVKFNQYESICRPRCEDPFLW